MKVSSITVGAPICLEGFTLWPLSGGIGQMSYDVPATGVSGLHYYELPTPEVGTISAFNSGPLPYLLPAGWIVEGLKQSRMVLEDVMVFPGTSATLDVVCVERGRWGPDVRVCGVSKAPLSVLLDSRRTDTVHGRQLRVWRRIADREATIGQRPTSSLAEIIREDERRTPPDPDWGIGDGDVTIGDNPLPDESTGYVVARRSCPVVIELFSRPAALAATMVESLRSLRLDMSDPDPSRSLATEVEQFLRLVALVPHSLIETRDETVVTGTRHAGLTVRALRSRNGDLLHLSAVKASWLEPTRASCL